MRKKSRPSVLKRQRERKRAERKEAKRAERQERRARADATPAAPEQPNDTARAGESEQSADDTDQQPDSQPTGNSAQLSASGGAAVSHALSNRSPSEARALSGWKEVVERHRGTVLARSLWQLVNTIVPYLLLWTGMLWTIQYSYWLTLPLAVVAAGFLVRMFIIFHDCAHGSFFRSKRANVITGFITGVLTFTPFHQWRRLHALHHGTAGDLDRRGTGDVWTLTVQEYLEATRWTRFAYRLARNPFVLFVFAPLYLFLIDCRIPSAKVGRLERRWVHWTNGALAVVAAALCLTVGWKAYLPIQLTVLLIGAAAGVWLFYVQHQFEGVYWQRQAKWDFVQAALAGSSFYDLPRLLQWFSGNIGFHHLHHLSPAIPNYNLERCHRSHALFRQVKPVTLASSLRSLSLRLWDEQQGKLVGYRTLRSVRRALRPSMSGPC